jgi:isocitrate/isopropylmalate dehydrogenase
MSKHTIAVIPGDGIGPEVISQARKVLDAAAEATGTQMEWREFPFGAERVLSTGISVSDDDLDEVAKTDAILLGALGDPRVPEKLLQTGGVLKTRFHFDQYVNLRPVRLYPGVDSPLRDKQPGDIDFYIVRENSEDFYISLGDRFEGSSHESRIELRRRLYTANFTVNVDVTPAQKMGFHLGATTLAGVERTARYAFELARRKGLRRLTAVDKVNVLGEMYEIWREGVTKTAREYPEIDLEFILVDAITMFFVRRPEHYQVVLAPNLFGDIISDLGAGIIGGMGLAPGANINPDGGLSMFEPIHGSGPDIAGKGIANPVAAILAGAMMLEHLGDERGARLVESAVGEVLGQRRIRTPDMGGRSSTTEVGDAITARLLSLAETVG